ncbi:MAG: 5'-nucleotidase C-terminal domain-containing protein, partial [Byssovorax sp.]
DNSITKMNLSGDEVQELFNFVARRSAGRACTSQVQIAGARVVLDCTKTAPPATAPGIATNIYIGTFDPPVKCASDADCPGGLFGACDVEAAQCWQPIQKINSYELATSNYLAAGGSGFRVLQRNTTQLDTKVQQRDALIDFIRAGAPCGADANGELVDCTKDSDCSAVGDGFTCACPETAIEGAVCSTDSTRTCGSGTGQCVLSKCRDDVAAFQHATCAAGSTKAVRDQCESALSPCSAAGEQCKFLACVNRRLGNFSDGRVRMVGQ